MKDYLNNTDPRFDEAMWRALDLARAYLAHDRGAIAGHLASLEPDQLDHTCGVLITMYNDSRLVLKESGRNHLPATVVREVDGLARFAPPEHEFAVTTAARRLARGELLMQDVVDGMSLVDRIHTMAVYGMALQLASFSRKRVLAALDRAAAMTEQMGKPRPYPAA